MSTPRSDTQQSSAGGERWFAVYTQPNKELQARGELQNQQFRVFLPQRPKTVRHARQTATRISPLFPRYLFVRLDPHRARWRSINGTRGVVSLVSFGEAPTPAPPGVVEALIAACDARGVMRSSRESRAAGSMPETEEPFADWVGTLDKLNGPESVRILLDVMGQHSQVSAQGLASSTVLGTAGD